MDAITSTSAWCVTTAISATAAAAYHSGWGTVDALLQKEEHSEDGLTLSGFPYNQMHHYVEKDHRLLCQVHRAVRGLSRLQTRLNRLAPV